MFNYLDEDINDDVPVLTKDRSVVIFYGNTHPQGINRAKLNAVSTLYIAGYDKTGFKPLYLEYGQEENFLSCFWGRKSKAGLEANDVKMTDQFFNPIKLGDGSVKPYNMLITRE